MSDFNIKKFLTESYNKKPLYEGNADAMAREVAQDMVDSGFAATSDQNFNDMYEKFMDRYREGWGWPDQFREDVRAAYKAILKKKAMSGSDFNELDEHNGDEYDDMEFGGGAYSRDNEPQDDDGFIQDTGRLGSGYSASVEGKHLGEFDDMDEAIRAIKNAAGPGWFPNIWYTDDHGGMEPVTETGVEQVEEMGDMFTNDLSKLKEYAGIKETQQATHGEPRSFQNGYKDAMDNEGDDMSWLTTHWAKGERSEQYRRGYEQGVEDWANGIRPRVRETAPQGAAPGAQLKGKDKLKGKGVKGYNDAHPASGKLVGEGSEDDINYYADDDPENIDRDHQWPNKAEYNDEPVSETIDFGYWDWESEQFVDLIRAARKWISGKGVNLENGDGYEEFFQKAIEQGYEEDGLDIIDQVVGGGESVYDAADSLRHSANYQETADGITNMIDMIGYEPSVKAALDEDPWGLGDHRKDYEHNSGSEDPRTQDIRNQTRGSEWETSGPDKYDPEHGLEDPFGLEEELLGELTNFNDNKDYDSHGAAWAAKHGLDEDTAEEEEWRMAMGHDQDDPDEILGGGPESYFDDNGEEWDSKDAYDDYHNVWNVHEDEDDDFMGKGEADMGSDTVVSPGDLVSVDASLGGEATVVAQRPGYIVVNLPKGGMKLLRDDEWWIEEDPVGGSDGYVDVDYDDEEPEELMFDDDEPQQPKMDGRRGPFKSADGSVYYINVADGTYYDPESDEDMDYTDFKMREDQAQVMGQHSQDDRQDPLFREGYTILPPMDDRYVERDGLEGPFRLRSGKVYYYDPKAGKNYDPDTDMYMSDEDWFAHDADPNQIKPKYKAPAPAAPKPRERGRMDEAPGMLKKMGKKIKRAATWGGEYSRPADMVKRHQEYSTDTLKGLDTGPTPKWATGVRKFQDKLINRNLRKRGERDFEKYMPEAGGKQLTYKTDFGEIAPKKLDGLIMQAIKMYSMDPAALADIRDAVLDDYIDGDISQVSVQDIVEIMDASGFEPGDGDLNEVGRYQDHEHTHDEDKAVFKRQEMDHELRNERGINNYMIFINGKSWKTVKNERHAASIVSSLQKKGKDAEYKYGAYPMNEADSDKIPVTKGTVAWMKKAEKELMPGAVKLVKRDGGAQHGVTTSDPKKIAQLKKDGYKVVTDETAPKHGSKSVGQAMDRAGKERKRQLLKAKRMLDKGSSVQSVLDQFPAVYRKDLEESTPPGKGYLDANTNRFHEIEWLRKKIISLRPKLERRPSTMKEIRDLERQIRERGGTPDKHDWLLTNEGTATHKKGPKMKGGGYNKPGSPKEKKAASKAGRQQDKKAVANEAGKTKTYTGDLATTEVEPPYRGFSRLGMKDLAEWIKLRKDIPRWADLVKKAKKVLNDKRRQAKYMKGKRPTATKYKYTIAKQVGGDDGYQWAVINKQTGRTIINGLTKPEVKHYRDRAERDIAAKLGEGKIPSNYAQMMARKKKAASKPKLGEEMLDELFNTELNELETATDQLDQERGLGEPTQTEPSMDVDSEAELAGMQQLIKNTMQEPDQDMEDAIQQMAMGDEDPNASLATDEIQQLRNLLGMFKQ